MTAVLVGSLSLSGAIPGLDKWLTDAGNALQKLSGQAKDATGVLSDAASLLGSAADGLDGITEDLISKPFDALEIQITTVQGLLDDLDGFVGSPSDYLQSQIDIINSAVDGLVDQLEEAEEFLQNRIDAMSAGLSGFQGQLDELENQLTNALSVQNLVSGAIDSLNALNNTLDDAIDSATDSISDFLEALSQLSNSGIYVVHYNGTLNNLGGEVDAVLPATGVAGDNYVVGPLLVAQTVNGPSAAAIRSVFGITI